ncbi:MAG: hypothetical protein ABIG42_05965, partial [bacterium]
AAVTLYIALLRKNANQHKMSKVELQSASGSAIIPTACAADFQSANGSTIIPTACAADFQSANGSTIR